MPEGHTIRRLAMDLGERFAGHHVSAETLQDRFAAGAARLDGRLLERTDAYGKHLFLAFETGLDQREWVHVHLGLYGSFRIGATPAPEPRGALRLRLRDESTWADLRGATACELITPPEKKAIEARLGPDPLRRGSDPDRAWARISRSRVTIAALLMMQEVVAGVGNVYRAEVLYRHRIAPHRPGREITRAEWDALWADLRVLLRAGVRARRIVTTRPQDRDRRTGTARRDDSFYVYRRAGLACRVCGTTIRSELLAGRTLYWCPVCQAF